MSANLCRQHFTPQQRAIIAVQADELYKLFAEQAKERQGTRTDLKKENTTNITQKIEQSQKNDESTETPKPDRNQQSTTAKLANAFGTNRSYVAAAQKVKIPTL